jgi:iron complex outermembrane receptor protein
VVLGIDVTAVVLTATAEEKPHAVTDEIVVTARRREENVQDVPVAATVVTADQLEEASTADIRELQGFVPNMTALESRNQSTTLTAFIRGIGQVDALWGVDPGVGVYIDDVYLARPQGALLDVYDVERIEVLRGPQGTLYGKNTIGGAIKYVSRALSDTPSGAVSISAGSFSNLDVRLAAGGSLVPGKLRGRIAFASLERGGWGTNEFTGRDVSDRNTLAGRGALEWRITGRWTARLSADFMLDDAQPKGYQRLAANPFCPAINGQACPPDESRWDTTAALEPLNGTDSSGGSLLVEGRLGATWRFKSISSYRQSQTENNVDFDTTPGRIADVIGTLDDEQISQEFQFVHDGRKASAVLGAYWFDAEAGGLVRNIFLDQRFTTNSGRTFTKSAAVFADGTYRFAERWALNAGARLTRETKRGQAFNAAWTDDTFSTVAAVTADYDDEETFDSLAPRLGVDYRVNDDVFTYLSLSRGFKSGGFNIRAQTTVFPESGEPFDDEVLDMAEIGVKSVLADGSLRVNAAGFFGRYHHVQVSTFTAYDSDGDGVEDAFFGNFLNAGQAKLRGVEIEFDYGSRAAEWLAVRGFAGYLDAEPAKFLDENGDGFVDTQMIVNAPELTAALRVDFDAPLWRGLLTASAGVSYRSEATLTNEGGQYPGQPGVPLLPITQDAFALYDAWVSWLSPDSRWRVGITGKNLTDEAYLASGYNVPALGILTGSYGPPRTVLATLEYRFF